MAKDKRNKSGASSSAEKDADTVASYILKSLASKATGGIITGPKSSNSGNDSTGILTRTITALSAKILAVLGPIALFGLAVTSAVSGLQPFFASLKLVGSLLGAFLAPIFITLSAAIFAVVTVFEDDLISAAQKWAELIFTKAVQAIDYMEKQAFQLGETLLQAALAALNFVREIQVGIAVLRGTDKELMNKGINDDPIVKSQKELSLALKNIRDTRKAGGGFGEMMNLPFLKNMKEGDFGKAFRDGIQNGIQEMRMSIGPQAQSSDLLGASRQAQLAALNQSPYEQKMLDLNTKILAALQQSADKATRPVMD